VQQIKTNPIIVRKEILVLTFMKSFKRSGDSVAVFNEQSIAVFLPQAPDSRVRSPGANVES